MTRTGRKAKDAEIANQSFCPCNKGQKINNTELIPTIVIILTSKSRKIEDTKFCAKDAMKKTCTSRIIKLFVKAKDAKKILSNSPEGLFFGAKLGDQETYCLIDKSVRGLR